MKKDGRTARFRRDAQVQSFAAAHAEAKRRMNLAAETGEPEQREPEEKMRTSITFASFVAGPFETQFMPSYRPATAKRYRALLHQSIMARFREMPLDQIGTRTIREYAADIQSRGHQTKPFIAYLRTILRAAVETGHLDELPPFPPGLMRSSKKLPDAPSGAEVELMLTAPGWIGLAVALAAYTGMRSGEVRALQVGDVDLLQRRIVIRRALNENTEVTPKSGHERVVPLLPELEARLREAMKSKTPRARVVVTPNGRTPGRQEVRDTLNAFLKRNGARPRSFHSLRHYFVSELVRRGAGLEAVRMLAGHSKLEMTQRYAHANAGDLRSAMDRLATK